MLSGKKEYLHLGDRIKELTEKSGENVLQNLDKFVNKFFVRGLTGYPNTCSKITVHVRLISTNSLHPKLAPPHSDTTGFIFNWIFFILAGNEDMHESLDELEFRIICNRLTSEFSFCSIS